MVVFFGAKDLAEGAFNFFQLGRELNQNVVFLNNGANDWYQYGVPGLGSSFEATVGSLKRWRDAIGANEICAIGTSMGGYAAVQYGAALGARILSFSTDAVLNAPHSQSERHFKGEGPPSCADLRPLIASTSADVTLFVGERDVSDIYSAHLLRGVDGVKAVSLIGVGHVVPSFLSRAGRLAPLLRRFIAGREIGPQVGAGQALEAEGYPEAAFAAHCATKAGDWTTAEELARVALTAYPYGEAAELLLGLSLLKQHRFSEAADALSLACVSQPTDVNALTKLAGALRRSGGVARARQIYQQILTLSPDHHQAHYGMCLLHLIDDDAVGARASIERALRIAPKNKSYLERKKKMSSSKSAG